MLDVIDHAGDQIPGSREYQEDALAFKAFTDSRSARRGVLLVLADGMGGHYGGNEASLQAVQGFLSVFAKSGGSIHDALGAGLQAANAAIAERKAHDERLSGMGCTLVAVFVTRKQIEWISVGDSPLWVVRGGRLVRINQDHSFKPILEKLVQEGELTVEQALEDPRQNVLRAALTGTEPALLDHPDRPFLLQPGDAVLLASDGILTLSDTEIVEAFRTPTPALNTVHSLLNNISAKQEPEQDNATVIIAWPDPEPLPSRPAAGAVGGLVKEGEKGSDSAKPQLPIAPPISQVRSSGGFGGKYAAVALLLIGGGLGAWQAFGPGGGAVVPPPVPATTAATASVTPSLAATAPVTPPVAPTFTPQRTPSRVPSPTVPPTHPPTRPPTQPATAPPSPGLTASVGASPTSKSTAVPTAPKATATIKASPTQPPTRTFTIPAVPATATVEPQAPVAPATAARETGAPDPGVAHPSQVQETTSKLLGTWKIRRTTGSEETARERTIEFRKDSQYYDSHADKVGQWKVPGPNQVFFGLGQAEYFGDLSADGRKLTGGVRNTKNKEKGAVADAPPTATPAHWKWEGEKVP